MNKKIKRNIVVFERDERYTDSGKPELDFRLIRGILPVGSSPLAIVTGSGFLAECGQWFTEKQVREYAREQSGFSEA